MSVSEAIPFGPDQTRMISLSKLPEPPFERVGKRRRKGTGTKKGGDAAASEASFRACDAVETKAFPSFV